MNLRCSIVCLAVLGGVAALAGCGPTYLNPLPDSEGKDLRAQLVKKAGGAAGGAEVVAETAKPTGFATLKGRFTVAGTLPASLNPPQAVSKHQEVCAPGGVRPLSQNVVVGAGGGLANLVIFADGVPEDWCHVDAKPAAFAAKEAIFDQKDCLFVPHVFACVVGQPVVLKNSDSVDHNTNLSASKPQNKFDRTVPAGSSTVYSAAKEESAPFTTTCAIHTWMQGYMIPRNNSYFAVTKADGSFEIPNLPAGVKVKFRVWQEKLSGTLKVKVNGEDKQWSLGKFEDTLTPGEVKNLEVTLGVEAFAG